MTDNRKVAADVITEAADTIINKRPGVHGDAEDSFGMIADLWNVWIKHKKQIFGTTELDGHDVAQMMSMLKKARAIYGDPYNKDNFVDDIGYTALSAMIRLPSENAEVKEFAGKGKPAEKGSAPKAPTLKEAT